jgi:ribosomal protein S18 acetylase RimI-like enzyme
MRGVVLLGEERAIRLLVTDDRGYDGLVREVVGAREGVVVVFDRARRCRDFLLSRPGWCRDRPVTAMVLADVHAVPAATLPGGLVLRSVRRLVAESPKAVRLEDAVAVAIASDAGITETPTEFARFLRGLPPSVRLFAAVDDAGVVRATSGFELVGEYARIFFVNTEPSWRRRGIGRAMTLEALRSAGSSGARRAFLHATDDGASVYRQIGFDVAGRLTRHSCVG